MASNSTFTATATVVKSTVIAAAHATNTLTSTLIGTVSATKTTVARAGEETEIQNGWSRGNIIELATLVAIVVLPPVGFLCHAYVVRRWFPIAAANQSSDLLRLMTKLRIFQVRHDRSSVVSGVVEGGCVNDGMKAKDI
ncbi:hypothetical protein L207DRAFT_585528 [Hyaloscypha variabilis F]|uniref:Uncharacterized protein n=1 Tax=Hyaloscypha variabilis (strain UAMH 11265 / GT02V1 / F) TaxID=1149755 RepID=A0A2J6RFC3_HYAVF|nr:hypothetical protein L207DRAFT_585528 [Hyaloscypha variabilis F]